MSEINVNAEMKDNSYYDLVMSQMETDGSGYNGKSFDNFFGAEESVEMLKERFVLPLRFPQLFHINRSTYSTAIMLYGPPGCGKSHLIFAAAKAAEVKLFVFRVWDLQNRSIGGEIRAEKCIETVFEVIRNNSPCILCFDDLEVFSKEESQFKKGKMALLNMLHTGEVKCVLIGLTQTPWNVDYQLRRKFMRMSGSYVRLPDQRARVQHLESMMKDMSHDLTFECVQGIAERTQGFTGADLHCLVRSASMRRIKELMTATHFKAVQCQVRSQKEENTHNSTSTASTDSNVYLAGAHQNEKQSVLDSEQSFENVATEMPGDVKTRTPGDVETRTPGDVETRTPGDVKTRTPEDVETRTPGDVETGTPGDVETRTPGDVETRTPGDVETRTPGDVEIKGTETVEISKPGKMDTTEKFMACKSEDEGAIPMSVFDIHDDQLFVEHDITMLSFDETLHDTHRSVRDEELARLQDFRENYG